MWWLIFFVALCFKATRALALAGALVYFVTIAFILGG